MDIYDGKDNDKYVLVGNDMYLSAVVNDGANDEVTWTIDNATRASIKEEDGSCVVTGLKGGMVNVTATSKHDANVKATIAIEVVPSTNYNQVLIDTITEIQSQLPEYTAADFQLPVIDNEKIQVVYYSKNHTKWADGVYKLELPYTIALTVNAENFANDTYYTRADGVYTKATSYTEGEKYYTLDDIAYTFYVNVSYRGAKSETTMTVKNVKNAEVNDFSAIEAAKQLVSTGVKDVVENLEAPQKIGVNATGVVVNGTTYTYNLPSYATVEETGQLVEITWEDEDTSDNVSLKTAVSEKGNTIYYISYDRNKMLADTRVQMNCNFKSGSNRDVIKFHFVIEGDSADDVIKYCVAQGLCPANGATITKSFFKLSETDTTNKYKSLKIVWVVDDKMLTYANGVCTFKASGTTTLKGTFYYGLVSQTVLVDTLDENGNLVKDENGNVVQHEEVQESYTWKKEVEITITK